MITKTKMTNASDKIERSMPATSKTMESPPCLSEFAAATSSNCAVERYTSHVKITQQQPRRATIRSVSCPRTDRSGFITFSLIFIITVLLEVIALSYLVRNWVIPKYFSQFFSYRKNMNSHRIAEGVYVAVPCV